MEKLTSHRPSDRAAGHTALAMELASRRCGTNAAELGDRGMDRHTSSGVLANMVASGRLHRVEGHKHSPTAWPLHQYFVRKDDADAWIRIPLFERPNLRLRRSSANETSGRQNGTAPTIARKHCCEKAPAEGAPVKSDRVMALRGTTVGIASGFDQRLQVDPATFAGGEFSRAGIGRYVAEANSCSARRTV